MVVDTSALVAILLAEPGYERLRDAMRDAPRTCSFRRRFGSRPGS